MAAIPTVLVIGNAEVNGSQPPISHALFWLLQTNKYRLYKHVPSQTDGTLASPVPYLPWWDSTLSGALGNFTVYNPMPGVLPAPYNVNVGDNHYSGSPWAGCGMTAWLMQRAADYWTAPPYFKMIKYAFGAANDGIPAFKPGSGGYIGLGNILSRAATLVSTDTLDLKLIVIDCNGGTTGDIAMYATNLATYIADMKSLITQLRTDYSAPNAIVVLISHAPSYLLSGSGSAANVLKAFNYQISYETSNVFVVEMQDKDLAVTTKTVGNTDPGNNRSFYHQYAYFEQADRVFDTYIRRTEYASSPSLGNHIPMVVCLGDSQSVGRITSGVQAAIGAPLSNERQNQFIYNATTATIQKLLPGPGGNFNTLANTDFAGYLFTMSEKFAEKYNDGVLFVQCGKNGATATFGGAAYTSTTGGCFAKGRNENYEQLTTLVSNAKLLAMTQTSTPAINKTPVPALFVIALGDNDAVYSFHAQFKSSMRTLINNLRNDFGMVQYGIPTPVIIVRISTKPTVFGSVTARTTIRQSVEELTKELDNVGYLDTDEYDLADTVHYSAESEFYMGVAIYEKYLEMIGNAIPTL